MKRKPNHTHRNQSVRTDALKAVSGGMYFRTNVWGELGAQIDAFADGITIGDGGISLSDYEPEGREEYVGTHP